MARRVGGGETGDAVRPVVVRGPDAAGQTRPPFPVRPVVSSVAAVRPVKGGRRDVVVRLGAKGGQDRPDAPLAARPRIDPPVVLAVVLADGVAAAVVGVGDAAHTLARLLVPQGTVVAHVAGGTVPDTTGPQGLLGPSLGPDAPFRHRLHLLSHPFILLTFNVIVTVTTTKTTTTGPNAQNT